MTSYPWVTVGFIQGRCQMPVDGHRGLELLCGTQITGTVEGTRQRHFKHELHPDYFDNRRVLHPYDIGIISSCLLSASRRSQRGVYSESDRDFRIRPGGGHSPVTPTRRCEQRRVFR